MKIDKIEMRSAVPIETRDDDPLAVATAAVRELSAGFTEFRSATDTRLGALDEITARLDEIEARSQRPEKENDDAQ